nr:hypothetical protein CFP56_33937 [Quercus suber]
MELLALCFPEALCDVCAPCFHPYFVYRNLEKNIKTLLDCGRALFTFCERLHVVEVHQKGPAFIREWSDMVDCGRRLLTFCSVGELWLYTYIRSYIPVRYWIQTDCI